jgi:hypothetical protein
MNISLLLAHCWCIDTPLNHLAAGASVQTKIGTNGNIGLTSVAATHDWLLTALAGTVCLPTVRGMGLMGLNGHQC